MIGKMAPSGLHKEPCIYRFASCDALPPGNIDLSTILDCLWCNCHLHSLPLYKASFT